MKKQLLLGTALLAAISAFPQQRRVVGSLGMSPAQKVAYMNSIDKAYETTPVAAPAPGGTLSGPKQQTKPQANRTAASTWMPLSGSANPLSVLVHSQRALNYNEALNSVAFIHRKSKYYTANPVIPSDLLTGIIVAEISSDGGATFDSTCIWNHNTQTGRYPQGIIYNPTGNTNISGAYVIGTGPALPYNPTASGNWAGNFFASKPLAAFTNSAGADMQFMSSDVNFGGPYNPAVGKVNFARHDLTTTSNGNVYLSGSLVNDANGATINDYRGIAVIKGTFNASTQDFTWATWDSVTYNNPAAAHSFSAALDPDDGTPNIYVDPRVSWNQAGTVCYVWTIGQHAGYVVGPNSLYQPMVWKYDANATPQWSYLPPIDFTTPELAPVMERIDVANGDASARYPNFNSFEEWDATVDANNNLHIVSTVYGVNDTVQGHQGYDDNGEIYMFEHYDINGDGFVARPYIFDFTYTGVSGHEWKATLIDSLETEAPAYRTSLLMGGYMDHPWSPNSGGTDKNQISARLQASRTTDGQYILYSWVDSDPNFTNGGKRWNNIPNIKVKAMEVATGIVSDKRYDATDASTPYVGDQAFYHYSSQITKKIGTGSGTRIVTDNDGVSYSESFTTLQAMLPLTATTNSISPTDATGASHISDNPVSHFYSSAVNTFTFVFERIIDGIKENALNSAQSSVIYPNPAKNNATLKIDLKDNSKVDVSVMNILGQTVKTTSVAGTVGSNKVNIDLSGLSAGVYMVNVKVGTATSTKKLIVD